MNFPSVTFRSFVSNKVCLYRLIFCTIFLALLSGNETYGQCHVSIQPQSTEVSCLEAISPVVWRDLVNVVVTNNVLSKIDGRASWNGGAASTIQIGFGGSVFLVVQSTSSRRMFGLSEENSGADQNSIRHAFHLEGNGNLRIQEFSSNRGNFGSYSPGDTLRIEHTSEGALYYRNSQLIYVSALAPVSNLIVDISLRDSNATLGHVFLVSPTDGHFSLEASGEGAGSSYQWFVNGIASGSPSADLILGAPSAGDIISCRLVPEAGTCFVADTLITETMLRNQKSPEESEFYITSTPAAAACQIFSEEVVW
ncbi:MAG: hypothetical protein WBG42_05300, partial [Cryomorphaceae bacterium]